MDYKIIIKYLLGLLKKERKDWEKYIHEYSDCGIWIRGGAHRVNSYVSIREGKIAWDVNLKMIKYFDLTDPACFDDFRTFIKTYEMPKPPM